MDRMQAPPRGAFFGLLSDLASGTVGYMQDPRRTQQMQGLGAMLESTRIPSLLEGLSYGDSMTTGSGMTMRPNEDVRGLIELATAFAPAGKPAAAAAKAGTMALGRAGERAAERMVPQVMERGGLPAQLLTDLAQGSRSKMFIGPEAKTWDQKAAIKAANMERKGATPAEIWAETGTVRGPDKMWRQEISDDLATLNPIKQKAIDWMSEPGPSSYPSGKVSDLLAHTNLNNAYPEVLNIRSSLKKGEGASYYPNDGFGELIESPVIFQSGQLKDPSWTKSQTLHELQHAIQKREGWAAGAGSDEKNYRKFAGEAEARLVQRRMDLTPEQRRQNFPFQYTGDTGFGFDVDPTRMILMTPEGSILERGLLGNLGR